MSDVVEIIISGNDAGPIKLLKRISSTITLFLIYREELVDNIIT
jgi:hypothetical protein